MEAQGEEENIDKIVELIKKGNFIEIDIIEEKKNSFKKRWIWIYSKRIIINAIWTYNVLFPLRIKIIVYILFKYVKNKNWMINIFEIIEINWYLN